MKKPLFIALEGIDGAGTTTQAHALGSVLRARLSADCVLTHEPSPGVIGQHIRSILRAPDCVMDERAIALLFAADRLMHYRNTIKPAIERGEWVLCDRYVLSSWVYQSEILERLGDHKDYERWIVTLNQFAPLPDLTILLDVNAKVAFDRVHGRTAPQERYELEELQSTLAARYLRTVQKMSNFVVVDGNAAADSVTEAIWSAIQNSLGGEIFSETDAQLA